MIETVRQDPAYKGRDYTEQPRSLKLAAAFYATATNGGTLAYQKLAPTRAKADALVEERLRAPFTADANDWMYAWQVGDFRGVLSPSEHARRLQAVPGEVPGTAGIHTLHKLLGARRSKASPNVTARDWRSARFDGGGFGGVASRRLNRSAGRAAARRCRIRSRLQ